MRHVDYNVILNKRYFTLKMISLKWYWHYNCITWTLKVWFIHSKAIHTFKCTWKIWTNKTFLNPVMLIHLIFNLLFVFSVCALFVASLHRFSLLSWRANHSDLSHRCQFNILKSVTNGCPTSAEKKSKNWVDRHSTMTRHWLTPDRRLGVLRP